MDTGGCIYSRISLSNKICNKVSNKINKDKIREISSILEDIDFTIIFIALLQTLNSSFFHLLFHHSR